MIVHLRVGEVTLFLAARDQQLELRLTLFRQHVAARRKIDEFGVALLALLAIGRSGSGRRRRGLRARGRELLRGLEIDNLALGVRYRRGLFRRLAFGERLLHFGMFLDVLCLVFRM